MIAGTFPQQARGAVGLAAHDHCPLRKGRRGRMVGGTEDCHKGDPEGCRNVHRPRIVGNEEVAPLDDRHEVPDGGLPRQVEAAPPQGSLNLVRDPLFAPPAGDDDLSSQGRQEFR